MQDPKITIGLPSYDREKLLIKKIRNLAKQKYHNWSLLLSFNKQPSLKTLKLIRKVLAKKKFKIVIQKKNIGAWKNFLYVLNQANTPYFMWASDDDYHSPFFIKNLLQLSSGRKKPLLLMSGFENVTKNGKKYREAKQIWEYMEKTEEARQKEAILDPEAFGKANYIYGVWRTKSLKQIVKGLQEHACVDQVIVMHALLQGNVKYTKQVLFKKYNYENHNKKDQINFLKPEKGYFFNLIFDQKYKYNLLKMLKGFKTNKFLFFYYQRLFNDFRIFLSNKIPRFR